ncbi:MAG: response regulator transcription factor [Gammaproteobacteria bacterium]|nr:MAG: response regulator transcription factor [Gammaproteobacteria bacterium]
MIRETDQILVVCQDDAIANRFAQVLHEEYTVNIATTWDESMESINRHQHQVLMLDPALLKESTAAAIEETCLASPDTRIIIIETPSSPDINQVELFKHGVHGFCRGDIAPELLLKAMQAVCSGELWLQRSLITQVIDELARIRTPGAGRKVKCLTPRELEVAEMVHKGGNNKTIARKLDISERTVKAHLSAIFRKLDIENRLHLALFFNDLA